MNKIHTVSIKKALTNIGSYSGWFYLPSQPWTLETEGVFVPYSKDPDFTEIPDIITKNKWHSTLDSDSIEDIVLNTIDQVEDLTPNQLFDAFKFYFDNDAFIVF